MAGWGALSYLQQLSAVIFTTPPGQEVMQVAEAVRERFLREHSGE